jgi:23S rRNA pseudouridine2605 synthase
MHSILLVASWLLVATSALTPMTTVLFHKPAGCVTTHSDNRDLPAQHERKTVYDHLPDGLKRMGTKWHAVGRLDLKTSGLLLMTTDGNLVKHVCDPETKLKKTYRALCMGHLEEERLEQLRQGVDLAGGLGFSAPCDVELEGYEGRSKTCLSIKISQGKNRQVRRMLHSVKSGVIELQRVSIGGLTLDGIEEPGDWRWVGDEEMLKFLDYKPPRLPLRRAQQHRRYFPGRRRRRS